MQPPSGQNPQECPCLAGYHQLGLPPVDFENRFVGVDRDFGEVTVARCQRADDFGCIT
jgi:hypothetical protein